MKLGEACEDTKTRYEGELEQLRGKLSQHVQALETRQTADVAHRHALEEARAEAGKLREQSEGDAKVALGLRRELDKCTKDLESRNALLEATKANVIDLETAMQDLEDQASVDHSLIER